MRTCNDYCKHPQPRFHLHSEYTKVALDYLFIPFTQCLPGCKATKNKKQKRKTQTLDGSILYEVVGEHLSCNFWNKKVQKSPPFNSRRSDPGKKFSIMIEKINQKA